MAKAIKLVRSTSSSTNAIKPKLGGDYSLPSDPTEPAESLIDYSFLIYGRKKIGKTSLVSRFPGAVFFMFEPGTKAQRVFKLPRQGECFIDWKDVRGYVRSLQKGAHRFTTVCFDPGNKAYDLCLKYVCERDRIAHPGKMKDYGASWKAVSNEFEDMHLQIANAGLAFVVVAHEKWDNERSLVEPKFSPSTEDFYEGVIDNIFYYHYQGTERFLQIRGTEGIVAGTRCEGHFMTTDGRPIYKIPMGNSADEAWDNLQLAWENQQDRSYGPDEEKKGGTQKKKLVLKKRS